MKPQRLINFMETGSGVAILAGFLLMLAGGGAVWLGFPMSEPVKGLELAWLLPGGIHTGISPATAFLGLVAILGVFVLMGWRNLAFVAWMLAWLLLFHFFWQLATYDSEWLLHYMQDSLVRSDIQRFNITHALINKGVEPSLRYITEFEHLGSRLNLVWEVLGWGWVLGVLGMTVAATGLRLRHRLSVPGDSLLLWAIIMPLLILMLTGWPTLSADLAHRRGDAQLAAGETAAALESYRAALDRDPVLASSAPFLNKVSRAYLSAYGEDDPRAVLTLLDQALVQKTSEQAEHLLNTRRPLQGGPFDAAIEDRLSQMEVQIYLNRGLAAEKESNYPLAIAYYRLALRGDPAAIHARYFLARALLETRDTTEAMKIADALPDAVYHASVKADFYGLIGDVYRVLGDHNRAREAYATAYQLDNKDNYRPMKELSGT